MSFDRLKKLGSFGRIKDKLPSCEDRDFSKIVDKMKTYELERSEEFGEKIEDNRFDAIKEGRIGSLRINELIVSSGAIVDSITVTYDDGFKARYGGEGGIESKMPLEWDDGIVAIYGLSRVDFGGRPTISRLMVETLSGAVYGPFGTFNVGEEFKICKFNHRIAALFGSCNGPYLSSLGAYFTD